MSVRFDPTLPSPQHHAPNTNNADRIEKYTGSLCLGIVRSFDQRRETDVEAKRELIAKIRRWFERLAKKNDPSVAKCGGEKRTGQAATDALGTLLRCLDDADVENLSLRHGDGDGTKIESRRRRRRSHNRKKPLPSNGHDGGPARRKRRRGLPSNSRSIDIVEAMHDEEEIDSDDDDDDDDGGGTGGGSYDNSRKFYLSNSDRRRRAERSSRSSSSRGRSCSAMGISLKAVMNARASSEEEEEEEEEDATEVAGGRAVRDGAAITSMTHEAAVLRRDLYLRLAARDVAEIEGAMARRGRFAGERRSGGDGKNASEDALPTKIKDAISVLFRRITSNPTSPSMRLSAVIALDSLRELDLSDRGYRCVLEELLEANAPWSLKFYAEIVSECGVYENPLRLLPRISELMRKALKAEKPSSLPRGDGCDAAGIAIPLLLRTISHIMVRRLVVISSVARRNGVSPLLRREIDTYERCKEKMSVCYHSASDWISSTMPGDVRESVISVLQAEGILSLFCCEDSDDEDRISTVSQSLQVADQFPYPKLLSLRAAHDRMGPCDGFNRLLSRPAAYEHSFNSSDSSVAEVSSQPWAEEQEDVACPLSSAHDDILRIIFSFLGYRTLSRASQCCKAWKRASNATSLWAPLYFRKYRNAYFEEELAKHDSPLPSSPPAPASRRDDARLVRFRSLRNAADRLKLAATEGGYDWRYIFEKKYATEKRCKAKKSCNVIGCLYVIRRADHARSHLKRHESAVRTQNRKWAGYETLQLKVAKLRQRSAPVQLNEVQPPIDIDGPHAVLKHLVFPYLDFKELATPVCKLWTQIANCNALWQSAYRCQFGTPNARFESPPADSDWKLLFQTTLLAHRTARGRFNSVGWSIRICPVPGCNKELRSKLDRDAHLLKHEEEMHRSNRIRRTSKKRQDQKRPIRTKKDAAKE